MRIPGTALAELRIDRLEPPTSDKHEHAHETSSRAQHAPFVEPRSAYLSVIGADEPQEDIGDEKRPRKVPLFAISAVAVLLQLSVDWLAERRQLFAKAQRRPARYVGALLVGFQFPQLRFEFAYLFLLLGAALLLTPRL